MKLIRIFCSERVSNCQSHVISVNEATLRHNCFETSLNFNDSALEGGGGVISGLVYTAGLDDQF